MTDKPNASAESELWYPPVSEGFEPWVEVEPCEEVPEEIKGYRGRLCYLMEDERKNKNYWETYAYEDTTWDSQIVAYSKEKLPKPQTDPLVESVRQKLLARSQVGIKKYGCTTADAGLDLKQWLIHLQEELMDATIYIENTIEGLEDGK